MPIASSLYRIAVILLITWIGLTMIAAEGTAVLGKFELRPAATLYIVVGDEPVTARVTIQSAHRAEGDLLTIRAFNPAEELSFWQVVEAGGRKNAFGPGDMEVWGIPLGIPINPPSGMLLFDADIPLSGAGVHHIRLVAGGRNAVAEIALSQPRPYGVSYQNGFFTPWSPDLSTVYAYVPPHAEELTVAGGSLRISDPSGAVLLDQTSSKPMNGSGPKGSIAITKTDVVWSVTFPDPSSFMFRATGMPLILCSTAEAASTIRASVEVLDDGTVVAHKFQRRIAELLPELLTPKRIGDTEALITPLAANRKDWLKMDPLRAEAALRGYAQVAVSLRAQNIDPTSHWSGASGSTWSTLASKPGAEGRWDRLRSLPNMFAGVGPNDSAATVLAFAATHDAPANPYAGRKELFYRAAAMCLRDLMTLGEDETWRGVGADLTDYAGMMAFAVGQKTFPPYGTIAPEMSQAVREVWTEGLRHIVDRLYPEPMVSARNQSSHYLQAFAEFARGSGSPRYAALATAYARRFERSAHPAGFQIESCGPDASYTGMTHWHQAVYYQLTGDAQHLEAIRKSYTFYNHTVAPEPDGSMLGGFNFNHRVGDGFYREQWSGARGKLDAVLPEVALWQGSEKVLAERRERAESTVRKFLDGAESDIPVFTLNLPSYLQPVSKSDRSGAWPAEEKKSFIRDMNGEMVAVKRPGYYTAIYVGKPAAPFYIRSREDYRKPYASNAESSGGDVNVRKVTPYLGGGMSLFWTPAYGNALLSTNWSPVLRHGVMAQSRDDQRWWEDYHATDYRIDQQAGTLMITGQIEGQPISYQRTYTFDDDALHVEVVLTAQSAVTLKTLAEILPFPRGAAKDDDVHVQAKGKESGIVASDTVILSRAGGADHPAAAVTVRLESEHDLRLEPNGLKRDGLQVGRVEIALPTEWKAGDTVTLRYQLVPGSAKAK